MPSSGVLTALILVSGEYHLLQVQCNLDRRVPITLVTNLLGSHLCHPWSYCETEMRSSSPLVSYAQAANALADVGIRAGRLMTFSIDRILSVGSRM